VLDRVAVVLSLPAWAFALFDGDSATDWQNSQAPRPGERPHSTRSGPPCGMLIAGGSTGQRCPEWPLP